MTKHFKEGAIDESFGEFIGQYDEEGEPDGFVKFYGPGFIYEGTVHEGGKHGWGRLCSQDDEGRAEVVVGWWKEGKRHGNVQVFDCSDPCSFRCEASKSGWYEEGVLTGPFKEDPDPETKEASRSSRNEDSDEDSGELDDKSVKTNEASYYPFYDFRFESGCKLYGLTQEEKEQQKKRWEEARKVQVVKLKSQEEAKY